MSWLRSTATSGQLIALFVVVSLFWGFFQLSDAVVDGDTHRFDTYVMVMLRNPDDLSDPLGPPWVQVVGRDVTALGGVGVLTFLVVAVAGLLRLTGQRRLTWLLLISVSTGVALSQFLKSGFDRPRPDLVSHEAVIYTASFPSGHSLMAAVVYLTLGVFLARTLENRAAKGYVISLAIFVVLAVGLSRIYLGVHWPTDVVAGWIVGSGWALMCGVLANRLDKRGRIEHEKSPDPDPIRAP